MSLRTAFLRFMGAWFLLAAGMLMTRPSALPVFLLVVPFGLLGVATYQTWLLGLRMYKPGLFDGHRLYTVRASGVAFSLVVVASLGLRSLGEFTVRDLITLVLLAVVGLFYTLRNQSSAPTH